jgi:hypothetical protein
MEAGKESMKGTCTCMGSEASAPRSVDQGRAAGGPLQALCSA